MLKVGITGGIGSGKTTACRIFETLGIPVYYADNRAKQLMVEDAQLIAAISDLLGTSAYTPDGQLDRAYVASVVFQDKKKLDALNAIVHPAVALDGQRWHAAQTNVPYTLKEAALLFESQNHRYLDKVITVFAPKEIRIQRVMARDGVDEASVQARMKRQMSDEEKLKLADYILYNDGEQLLIPQVLEIHRRLVG
ncbi:MAG: dephospho-CoA kinase [Bacteroidota bacterium]